MYNAGINLIDLKGMIMSVLNSKWDYIRAVQGELFDVGYNQDTFSDKQLERMRVSDIMPDCASIIADDMACGLSFNEALRHNA